MKQKKKKKTACLLIFFDICIVVCFFLAYGPFSYLRELYITTAMTTMSHKYLAHTIYTDETIEEVLSQNYIKESNESTDVSDIVIGQIDASGEYDSVYEEQILTKDPEHPDYSDDESACMSGIDYKWVEFLPQNDASVISYYPSDRNSGSSDIWSDSMLKKKTAEQFVYLNNDKQMYSYEQQFSISCLGFV